MQGQSNNALDQEQKDLLEIRFINKKNATFKKTPGGFISLEFNGKYYDRVSIYRTFPFTDPDHYISIREPDEKAKEIGIIKNLVEDVTKEAEQLLREQLALRYFTPVIQKIIDIKEEYGYAYFEVKTNFGECKFTIHMNSGSVVSLSEKRVLITDLDGNRFEIPDIYQLSASELKKLDLFI